jgi:PEP-CTERM motif
MAGSRCQSSKLDDGNVAQAANEILLVASVFQNLVTELIFTAPVSGIYSLTSSFIGDQGGIDVGVDVLRNGSVLFSSNVTSLGQVVTLTLAAGDTLAFAVTQGSGTQNTGDVSLTTGVPEPSTWAMMLLGFAGLGFAFRQSRRRVSFA